MQQDPKEFVPLLPTTPNDDDFVESEDFFGKEFMQQVLENERNPHHAYSVISALLPSQQTGGTAVSDKTLKTLRTIKRSKQPGTEHDGKLQESTPDDVEYKHKITGSMDLFEGWEDASESNEEAYLWKLSLLRNMPISMASKRKQKDRLTSKYNVLHVKVSAETNNNKLCSQFKENLNDLFSSLAIWRGFIKQIEGHFGASIASYFVFGRWLFLLNIFIFTLTFFFIVLPQILLPKFNAVRVTNEEIENCSKIYSQSLNRQNEKVHIYVLDFLQGTGWMESTLMFIGSYENLIQIRSPVFNLSLAYFLTISSVLLLSLILILRTTAHGVKKGVIISEGKFHNYCNTVFAGWDFCIIKSEAARLKSETLTTELTSYLEEERLQQKRQSRTMKEKIYLYFVRCVVNLVVLGLIVGGWVAIYEASNYTLNHLKKNRQDENEIKQEQTFMDLVKEYVPSLTISALNLVMPNVFYILVQYEQYSPGFVVNINLIRTVFLRLASIAVLLISFESQITSDYEQSNKNCAQKSMLCWETYVGQQIYKLVLLNFMISFVLIFIVGVLRRLIVKRFKTVKIIQFIGQEQFDIPSHVLELIYSQTLCWLGIFFSPLISVACIFKLIFIFYMKKFHLVFNCVPSGQPYRVSKSNSFFMIVLLLSFAVLVIIPLIYTIASFHPSKGCSPFRNNYIIWEVIPEMVSHWPKDFRVFLQFITSAGFAVPIIIILLLTMYYYFTKAAAYKKMSLILKEHLQSEGEDKRFLLKRLNDVTTKIKKQTMAKRRRNEKNIRFRKSSSQSENP